MNSSPLEYGSKKYKRALKKLGLKVYTRIDPTAPWWGYGEYLVAPIIQGGKKTGWQPYHYSQDSSRPRKTMKEFKTKKEAIQYIREEISELLHPWYEGLPGWGTTQGVYMSDGEYAGQMRGFDG